MKEKFSTTLLTAALLASSGFAAEKFEHLYMDSIANPKRWSPAESSVSLDEVKFNGRPVLKWVVPIDHFAGEKKYPVGWPRMYFTDFVRSKPVVSRNWQDWDFFEFDVRMQLEGDPQNINCSVSFQITGGQPQYHLYLKKLHDGKIHRIKIPVAKITNPRRITNLGFYISESKYKHGAKLTVQAGNFRFVRSTECNIEKVSLLTPAVTAADSAIKLALHVSGPVSDVARGVPFQLSENRSGKIIRQETLPVQRGEREIEIEIDELNLRPGDYTLTLFPDGKEKRKSVVFKLLSSPYKVKK